MLFEYKAIKAGRRTKGTLERDKKQEVLDYLRANGFTPIDVSQKTGVTISTFEFFQRPNFQDIINFTRQLAIMLNAGITIVETFEIFKKQLRKPTMLRLVTNIDTKVRGGSSLSSALADYPNYFSAFYISLIKAGEISGKLPEILNSLSVNLESQKEIRSKIQNALIYPAVVVTGMIVVMFVVITFVVPQLLTFYEGLDVPLPYSTLILASVATFLSQFWPIFLVLLGLTLYSLYRFSKVESVKTTIDKTLLRIPYINSVIIQSTLVDITRALSLLTASGVPILDTIDILKNASSNIVFKQAFQAVKDDIEKGVSVGSAFEAHEVFPPILVQMAIVGERTGKLDETMQKISDYFESESQFAVKTLMTLFEPAILAVLGVSVGFLIFSIIIPIYSVASNI